MSGCGSISEARRGSSHLFDRVGVARTFSAITERKPRIWLVASAIRSTWSLIDAK